MQLVFSLRSGFDWLAPELQKVEVSPGVFDVSRDLIAKGIYRRKLDLITQPLQEMNFNFRFRREFDGMKIQEMAFNRK